VGKGLTESSITNDPDRGERRHSDLVMVFNLGLVERIDSLAHGRVLLFDILVLGRIVRLHFG
jgi:hypothetical protein